MTPEPRTELTRRLAREDGIALVFAIQIMAVLTLLIAATLGSAMSLGNSTARDYDSKNALSAALSGLDVARYRLEQVNPPNGQCLTTGAVAPGSGGAAPGECPAFVGDLGNGTTYGYYVTPAVNGGTCAGQPVASGPSTDRCLTAYGTAGGVTRRVQALIRRNQVAATLFPFNGILGLSEVDIHQHDHFDSDILAGVGSNGAFTLGGHCPHSITGVTGWKPGPFATATEDCDGELTSDPPRSAPWTAPEAEGFFTGTETVNDNGTVFGAASGFDYDEDKRELKDKSSATLIINGPNPRTGSDGIWSFNFCKLHLTHNTQIKLQNGAVARFLIDSQDRAGSGCDNDADFKMTNETWMNYDSATDTPGNPLQFQVFVYGDGKVEIHKDSFFSGALYAPGSRVHFNHHMTFVGSIVADEFQANAGLDFTAGDLSSLTTGGSVDQPWARTSPGFVECRAAPTTASDPESGC